MDKYINGSLVKRVLVFKTRKHPDTLCGRFLFWKIHRDYWDPCFGTYTEEKMISSLEKRYAFYKDSISETSYHFRVL